ncbi:carbohydrate-binding protein [Streptomyces lancefieldiae]|uniref:Uncharacterized protein n=1 Tax=Streptomyces lancefieldiae TaxID=3075520 RepID=A0ABU3AFE8_9ACTN|nr:hypothetical protein [Streptomyces sp. DSM 40712]MDT0608714.1 hypothetical protein [Streptomyces sp. DSM 40712]
MPDRSPEPRRPGTGRVRALTAVTGTPDVHLTFTGGRPADLVNVNRFGFGR